MIPPVENVLPGEQVHDERVYRVELLISNLLRVGIAISLFMIVLGTITSFVRHPEYVSSHDDLAQLKSPVESAISPLQEMVTGLHHGSGQSIVMLGLIFLVATPVMRVAVSIFAFVYQGDRVFVAITTLVLFLLLLSFVLGKVEA